MNDDDYNDSTSSIPEMLNFDAILANLKEELETDLPWDFHTCKLCPYRTSHNFLMQRHQKRHRVSKHSKLFDCSNGFLDKYKCDMCDYKSPLLINFNNHIEVSHSNVLEIKVENGKNGQSNPPVSFGVGLTNILKSYSCENCYFKTYSQLCYINHYTKCPLYRISNETSLFRKNSDKRFLRCHNNDKHNLTSKRFKCKKCPYTAKRRSSLNKHMTSDHGGKNANAKLYICDYCSYYTTRALVLRNHVISEHAAASNAQIYTCGLCPYKTKWKISLHSHFKSHKMVNKHKCSECPYSAKEKRSLAAHVSANHKEVKFRCEQCSFETHLEATLAGHVGRKHPKQEWFKCEHCPYRTMWEENLQRHTKNLHEVAEGLECEMCGESEKDLRKHILSKHVSTEMVVCFKCHLCSFKTVEVGDLREHVERHVICQKLRCAICTFRFSTEEDLKRHALCEHIL